MSVAGVYVRRMEERNMRTVHLSDVEAIVKAPMAFLENAGFTFNGVEMSSSPILGRFVTLSWSNRSIQRMLRVTYFEQSSQSSQASLGTLMADIVHLLPMPVEQDDYTTFNSLSIPLPRLELLEGTTAQRLQLCAKLVQHEASGKLWSVLSGKEWKPVHFNWMGMK
jgi:hypothetical protein